MITFMSWPQARNSSPKAAVVLPLPSPVLIITSPRVRLALICSSETGSPTVFPFQILFGTAAARVGCQAL